MTPNQARMIADRCDDAKMTGTSTAGNALRSLADQVEALTSELNEFKSLTAELDAWRAEGTIPKLVAERDSLKKDAERMAYCLFGLFIERDRNSLTDEDRDMAGKLIDSDLIFAGEEDYPIFDDMRRILRAAIAKGTA